jgi:hypothetical protein
MTRALLHGAGGDPDVLRGALRIAGLLDTPDAVLGEPGMADKVVAAGADWRNAPMFGPTREELVAAVAAA